MEQSGMDLATAQYVEGSPSVYELFLEKGSKTYEPKDINILPGPEEPIDRVKQEFPNIEKVIPKVKQTEVRPKTDQDYYDKLSGAESSNNQFAQAKTSSAKGLFQFTASTWKEAVKKWGKDHGLTPSGIFNRKQQEKAVRLFTEDNRKRLSKSLGLPENKLDHTALYAAHFLGVTGATKLLTSPYKAKAKDLLPDAANANKTIFYDKDKGNRPRTVKEVIDILEKKMGNG